MINLDEIRALATRRPFRPFDIRFENGDALSVTESTELLFPRLKPNTVFAFEATGRVWIFEAEAVTALQG